MNAVMKDYYLLWRMALSIRHPRAHVFFLCATAIASLGLGVLIQLKEDDLLHTAILSLQVALGFLLVGALFYFVPGAVKLNTPATARLVPRMRRRLMGLTILAWVVATGTVALMAMWGNETQAEAALVFLGTGSGIAMYGLSQSGHRAAGLGQFALFGVIFFNSSVSPRLLEPLTHGSGFAVATLLMLALGAFVLQAMFMNGGERHVAACAARTLQAERLSATGQFRERKARGFGAALYRRLLARDCRRRDSERLLGHLLGAASHWVHRAIMLASLVAIVACVLLGVHLFASADTQRMTADIGWLFAAALLLVPFFDSERRNARLKDTAVEQALFRLAPPLPGTAAAFNRTVSLALLRGTLLEWAMLAATVLLLTAMTGTSASRIFMQACFCCLTLPLAGANLRDHARSAGLSGWRLLLGMAGSLGLSAIVAVALHWALGMPLAPGAALASIVIAVVVVARGLARDRTAPFAFPVGRLA